MKKQDHLQQLREKLHEYLPAIQNGSIRIILQDARVIQIEKVEALYHTK
ncbi:DUF2292 domain-containing protein [Kurthia gibsonii]|nr:DUF2292 domain-containing protein [Kurthia gibsonii]GED19037.1 hypothetical protein KGI01_07780 [Kurthia gibsonii]